ncbi:MAG: hypothetical protein HY443_01640 [Candidatus Nealsonbacteria bacterium]|nr:hypothetical protein [Candidatus Nealsonbacteria bacterium]
MSFLKKIQGLPEGKRKIILWAAIVVIGGIFLFFYVQNIQQKLKGLDIKEAADQLKIPEFKEELSKLPKIEEILNSTNTVSQ